MTYNTTRRRRFSKKQREAFLTKHESRCYYCGEAILPGQKWHIEHLVARELMPDGRADADDNLKPIHADPCHKAKSRQDIAAISKSNRIRRRDGLDPDERKPRPSMRGRGFPKGPKQRIASRPFPKGKRPIPSRKQNDRRN